MHIANAQHYRKIYIFGEFIIIQRCAITHSKEEGEMKKIFAILVAILSITFLAQSATAYNGNYDDWRASKVRVIHASPDAPAVDILVNGQKALSSIEFEQITDYEPLKSGKYNIQVVPEGLTTPVVIDADLKFARTQYYTIIALDNLNEIQPLVLRDVNRWVTPGYSRIRFVHASPDAPAVDIAVKDGPVLFSNVEFKDNEYVRVKEGTYDLEVRIAGTETVVLPLNNLNFENRAVYTAIATGEVSKGTLNAILTKDIQLPTLR